MDTNGYKAEFGQAGGGVISFASKSGTNDVHGSAYDFIRNDIADAQLFFAATKSIYKQNAGVALADAAFDFGQHSRSSRPAISAGVMGTP